MSVVQRPRAEFALLLGAVFSALPGPLNALLLPMHVARLALPLSAAAVLPTAYAVGLVLAALPMAALAGRVGLRRSLLAVVVVTTVLPVLMVLPPVHYWMLLGLAAFQGAVGGSLAAAVLALVRPVFGERRLAAGFGLVVAANVLGTAVLPAVSGAGMAWLGLPGLVAPGMAIALAGLVLGWSSLPATAPGLRASDVVGAALGIVCVGLLLGALYLAPFNPWRALLLLALGLVFLAFWVAQQLDRQEPLLPLDVLAWPDLAKVTVAVLLGGVATQMANIALVPHLVSASLASQDLLGVMLMASAAAALLAALAGFWAVARHLRWNPAVAGALLLSVGDGLLAWPGQGILPVLLAMATYGAGRGLFGFGSSLVLVGGAPPGRELATASLAVVAAGLGGLLAPFCLRLPLPQLLGHAPGEGWGSAALGFAAAVMLPVAWLCRRPKRHGRAGTTMAD